MNDQREIEDSGDKLRVKDPPETAAGVHAITAALKNVFGKAGVVRGSRGLLNLNQKGGIDCQSCAWPDPEHRTINEFCENGAKALADEAMTETIGRDFFAKYSIQELNKRDEYWLNKQGRLAEPLVMREGGTHYEPITWEEAFKLIAGELNSLPSPDEAIFYTSGRTSNEAAFLYQLFVRQFGTNNLPDCSNMCHESTSVALAESIGLGKATIRLEDLETTHLSVVIGQNPGTNSPRMLSSLRRAKQHGAKIISINPLAEPGLVEFVDPNPQHYKNPLKFPYDLLADKGTPMADIHLPIRIGGDMAVIKGLMKVMLERERERPGSVFDQEFISAKTTGIADVLKSLDETSWDDIAYGSGLSRQQIAEAADMIISSPTMVTCWAMGVTQHRDAVATIQDIVNMHLLLGQIGRPRAGLCPVRGHSNVQGDRTMGIWEKMNPKFRANLEREFNFKAPEHDGFHTVDAVAAMRDGRAKIFFAMGGNFVTATPDNNVVADGLRQCRLTVNVLTKLNRTALTTGTSALILPCLGRSEIDRQKGGEQFVSTESTMLNVQMSKGIYEPISEHLRSEPWIVCQLAKATLGTRTTVDWDSMANDYDRIRDAISRVVPGCENYNERVRVPGGFYLPNPPREGKFDTKAGKALFKASRLETNKTKPGELLLTTIRAHDQFNTTVYGYNDRYRGISGGRHVLFMCADDVAAHRLEAGQKVDITSHFEDAERTVRSFTIVPYQIPKGCVAAYFPEANELFPLASVAARSGTPTTKCIVVTVAPSNE
jgi:molybdopterin-dependent oxidoreductase alpha subunit